MRKLAAAAEAGTRRELIRRWLTLEYITLGWNVVGTGVSIAAALAAGSVALAGFGLDSLIEIGASTIVVWQVKEIESARERGALRLIGGAFITISLYIAAHAIYTLITGQHPHHSTLGSAWTAITCLTMLMLAAAKTRTGKATAAPSATHRGSRDADRHLSRRRDPDRPRAQRRPRLVVGRPARRTSDRLLRPARRQARAETHLSSAGSHLARGCGEALG